MLTYFIKVNIALAVFWIVYRLCFGRDTLFPLRRATLWVMALFALAWPLLVITVHIPTVAVPLANSNWADIPTVVMEAPTAPSFPLWMIPLGAYMLGMSFFFVSFLVQLADIITLRLRSRKTEIYGTTVRKTGHPSAPFSFFGWIFVDPAKYSDTEMREILTHERTHVRERHSVDVIFFELLRIAFWINPFAWLTKASVQQNLEYLADKDVISRGSDRRQYQYRLLQLSYRQPLSALTNHFSKSQLKNRIAMMNKKQTTRRGAVKYALILPLLFSLLLLTNVKAVPVYVTDGNPVTVTGTVRDEAGNPLKGASVILKMTSTGTTTDENGQYSLTLEPRENNVLVFSYVGLETIERQAADKLDVVMKESVTPIDAVNVNGHPFVHIQTEQVIITNRPDKPTTDGDEPFYVVEDMPQFQGGDINAFKQWVASSVRYPKDALDRSIQGIVILSFIVEKDGSVSNVEVIRSIDPSLDAEAVRAVSSSPLWKPGTQRGQAVRVKLHLPVDFKLGKTPANSEEEPFIVVENMPRFQGGDLNKFHRWAMSSILYPEEAVKKNVTGTVVVNFVVEKDGSVNNVKVIRSVDPSLDAEAVRVVSSSPRWEPGTQRGQAVRVKFNIPVNFNSNIPVNFNSTDNIIIDGIFSSDAHRSIWKDRRPGDHVPLFIVDGYEVEEEQAMKLNTDDITSITILKDGTAREIYGEKAANGVIVIETKSKKEKPEQTFTDFGEKIVITKREI